MDAEGKAVEHFRHAAVRGRAEELGTHAGTGTSRAPTGTGCSEGRAVRTRDESIETQRKELNTSSSAKKTGLEALLTFGVERVAVLIDHQLFQFANSSTVTSRPWSCRTTWSGLAKATAKGFSVLHHPDHGHRGGAAATSSRACRTSFPDQKPINRTTLNAWEDSRVVEAVKKTGRRQLIFRSALDRDLDLAYPVIHSLADGYDVILRHRRVRAERAARRHDVAVQRMVQAGAVPTTPPSRDRA